MINKIINNKQIHIVEDHHQVLEAWTIYKNDDLNVITLDSHIDTKCCITRNPNIVDDYLNNNKNINNVIEKLNKQEQIDFATRSKIVKKVFVLSYCTNGSINNEVFNKKPFTDNNEFIYKNEPIIEYNNFNNYINELYEAENRPKEESYVYQRKIALTPEILNDAIKYFMSIDESCLDNYILDIDLDYICTIYAFDVDLRVFKNLIKNAAVITIAKESYFVKKETEEFKNSLIQGVDDVKFFEEELTAEIILNKLKRIIDEI